MICQTPQLEVAYEDADIAIINKPAGIAVHKTRAGDPQLTIADLLVARYPDIASVGEDPLRPGIVHRLDKETSGLMVIAKTNAAFFNLKEQFKNRTVQKEYLALVHGTPTPASNTITAPLGKVGAKQTTHTAGKRTLTEREAVTDYRTVRHYGPSNSGFTLLEVSPHTGRTHQIRVHLASIGCPIAGDRLYGRRGDTPPPGLDRLFLHAQRLSFTAPSGTALSFEADLPPELAGVLDVLAGT